MKLLALLALLSPDLAGAERASLAFEKYVLESNGLEVILSEDHALPIVAVNVWYRVGPRHEAAGSSGFAHLFEHLMFQGSQHVGDDEYFKLLDGVGGSQVNGTTGFDRTNYFATVPRHQLPLVLWLESDRMGFLREALTQQKLDNQRAVVMNERRQTVENTPYGLSDELLMHLLFPSGHPYYGNIIGSMQDLASATLRDVEDFYERRYAPANATLTVVGDIDIEETKALIARYFGALPRRAVTPPPAVPKVAIASEQRQVLAEAVRLPRLAMGWLSPEAFAEGDAECDILALILGGGYASRLYRRLVYELEIAQDVAASQHSLELSSIFRVEVLGKEGIDPSTLEVETHKVLEELRATPPSIEEVTRARHQIVTMLISSLQNIGGSSGKADALSRYNYYTGDPGYLPRDLARYDAITQEAVMRTAKRVLAPSARAVVVTVPRW